MSAPRVLSARRPWKDRRIVLGVTGGIAAYKCVQLARDLTRLGARVDVVLTDAATRFVAPLSFEGVTGSPPLMDLFSSRGAALHIHLAREADAVVVAPATADFLARAAHGRADDLLTTLLLATRAPVLLAPAMNDAMFSHPQTSRNLDHLEHVLGHRIAGPATGPLAHGEGEGPGRMVEPDELVERVGRVLGEDPLFEGKTVLVTAGPTRERLDPVRYLGNRSSGRMGYALAAAAWRRGAEVILVSGPGTAPPPVGPELVSVETAREMRDAVCERAGEAHLLIFAAAVADFRPSLSRESKVKRRSVSRGIEVELTPNPDVATESRPFRRDDAVSVGFALETENLLDEARRKLEEKGFDMIVANDAAEEGAGFDVETNRVTFMTPSGEARELPLLGKDEVAEEILDHLSDMASERWTGRS